MTTHCGECGSEKCNHDNCPECNPCQHCNGGDRTNKFYGYDEPVNHREESREENE